MVKQATHLDQLIAHSTLIEKDMYGGSRLQGWIFLDDRNIVKQGPGGGFTALIAVVDESFAELSSVLRDIYGLRSECPHQSARQCKLDRQIPANQH
jgi:hypothetical protein